MQIGSAARYPLLPQASPTPSPSSLADDTPSALPSDTTSASSPSTTVTLSADGKRLAAADEKPGDAVQDGGAAKGDAANAQQAQLDRQKISELSSRDSDVRAHEAAHASVGGAYAGSPSYTLQRGPDGKAYAVGGEVGIDVSAVANDPAATISKMEVVMRAALAPADPSAQDLRVAAQAQGLASAARAELAQQRRNENVERAEEKNAEDDKDSTADDAAKPADAAASLQVYQSIASSTEAAPQIEAFA